MDRPTTVIEVVTVIALVAGPAIAVLITLWYQRRTEKRAAKERLFVTLMAHRKSVPPAPDWTSALNLMSSMRIVPQLLGIGISCTTL